METEEAMYMCKDCCCCCWFATHRLSEELLHDKFMTVTLCHLVFQPTAITILVNLVTHNPSEDVSC